ncbi:hypothetical protein [Epilithonimonas sp.]|uniref:hypothetical protein n=1 Tax=Epilithonimonas sp. TaxID=2894511 RepID=UPI0028B1F762|nr:hypothetical protein [Epilithonimonas sp.]
MITENVKNLFSFIDYLHSKKTYLLSKKGLIDDIDELLQKRNSIRPSENYKSKIEYDKIQKEIADKFDIIEAEIIEPIKIKIAEFDIADINTPIINLTAQSDLFELQRNFDDDDLKLIFEARLKYLEYRNETNCDYYLQPFFPDLDKALKEFYEFFKDEDSNEFNDLQTNFITVESLDEQGIEMAVRKLIGNSNKLHFETFPEFLDYLKKEVKDLDFDERHSEVKRMLEQQKIKLENSTFQSEIDEVKIFSENAVKDFKHKLMLSFTNENYKTKTVGFMPTHYNYVLGLIEYEKLYDIAKHKNYSNTIVKEQNQKAESIPAPQQNKSENQFSVLEWATIFYYADTTKLLPCDNLIKNRLETFMNNHKVSTTYDNFKTKYYEAKRRINDKNDYPIDKLQKIIPFLEINYDQTVTKVENDIIILEENISDY